MLLQAHCLTAQGRQPMLHAPVTQPTLSVKAAAKFLSLPRGPSCAGADAALITVLHLMPHTHFSMQSVCRTCSPQHEACLIGQDRPAQGCDIASNQSCDKVQQVDMGNSHNLPRARQASKHAWSRFEEHAGKCIQQPNLGYAGTAADACMASRPCKMPEPPLFPWATTLPPLTNHWCANSSRNSSSRRQASPAAQPA